MTTCGRVSLQHAIDKGITLYHDKNFMRLDGRLKIGMSRVIMVTRAMAITPPKLGKPLLEPTLQTQFMPQIMHGIQSDNLLFLLGLRKTLAMHLPLA